MRWKMFAATVLVPLAGACGGGTLVTLGERAPPPPQFGTPHVVANVSGESKDDNPTLTGDLLEIYFTSGRGPVGTKSDVWFARRTSAADAFGAPEPITIVNSEEFETSSAISTDGLTLWFGSDRSGNMDILVSTRASRTAAWSAPTPVAALNSPTGLDIPRPPGQGGTVMPLASTRNSGDVYRTFFATRADPAAAFGAPREVPELVSVAPQMVDCFLTDDGRTLFYVSGELGGLGDLFVARRRSTSDPFTVFQPLEQLNTAADERDPWMSPDGTRFFFSSDRSGVLTLYEVTVTGNAPR